MISPAKIKKVSETQKKMAGNLILPAKIVLLLILTDNLVFNLHYSKIVVKVVKTFDHLYFFVLTKHKNISRNTILFLFY